jgi:hypothetical protein
MPHTQPRAIPALVLSCNTLSVATAMSVGASASRRHRDDV